LKQNFLMQSVAGANPSKSVYESTGPAIEGIELVINNPDKKTGEGEIWAKGPSIMKGYYKEPEMTKEVLTPEGWFKTGDLGTLDSNNNLYIKGRLKNMIVGASGENVHINMEELEKKYHVLKQDMTRQVENKVDDVLYELQEYVNSQVSKFSQIQKVVLHPVPFQKTATLKIKRFLYT
jgi:long-chain acyl-CoA synthetase